MTEKQGEDLQECAAILEAAVRELVKEAVRNGYCLSSGCVRCSGACALEEHVWIDEVDEWFPEPAEKRTP
ncbi:MAG: hypothetical protein M5U21_13420 [Fimbriimonadaceae bacterium]|nr:hypothetical protein [Fimbriimonadaceae bacterium]MCZ7608456.1 hypothetical protein [Planctomycetota bacterium]